MIETIEREDEPAVLALNNEHAEELSWLEDDALSHLVDQGFYARRIGKLDAFIIAFDQAADYGSPNFIWFRERYPRFVYIDRITVARSARGRGLARLLYHGLFEAARQAGHDMIGCEVNLDPPNPGSDAFHTKLGFFEVGRATMSDGKTVRYYTHKL